MASYDNTRTCHDPSGRSQARRVAARTTTNEKTSGQQCGCTGVSKLVCKRTSRSSKNTYLVHGYDVLPTVWQAFSKHPSHPPPISASFTESNTHQRYDVLVSRCGQKFPGLSKSDHCSPSTIIIPSALSRVISTSAPTAGMPFVSIPRSPSISVAPTIGR